jgi:hypothetical protein
MASSQQIGDDNDLEVLTLRDKANSRVRIAFLLLISL